MSQRYARRRQAENVREYAETGAVSEPRWVHYQLWWYEGLAFMNLRGITESRYNGTQMQQTLGMLLDELTGREWRRVYGNLRSGYYLESLRRLLRDALGAYVWAEFTIGFSWRAYRALDFYLKLMSKGMAAPRDDAWYLLNATLPWDQRAYISPEEWWKVSDLLAVGQREAVSEWYLELTGHGLVSPCCNEPCCKSDWARSWWGNQPAYGRCSCEQVTGPVARGMPCRYPPPRARPDL